MEFCMPGPNKRVCAYLIDAIIISTIGIIVSLAFSKDIYWIVYALLLIVKDSSNGQSFGKYLVGTQVIDMGGSTASLTKTMVRNIFMAVPVLPLIEYFVMLSDKQEGRRIGDRVAKTKVNDLNPQRKDSTFLLVSLALVAIYIVLVFGYISVVAKQNPNLFKQ
jgi:uncharacterized RDD family membrane protein YckC